MTTIQLTKLTKRYNSNTAVEDLSIDIREGEMVVLLGPSGSGKTTTLRMIAGLLNPTSGDLLFDGRSILKTSPEKRGAVMVFQDHMLFPFMSVGDNVAFGLRIKKKSNRVIRETVHRVLESVQLAGFETRWPDELSGGQRQRVALARALAVEPKLLLLDEPLSNLEPGLREEMREMIRILQQQAGITTLFVTHDQMEAVTVADRIALLFNGRLQQIGPPRKFYERPANEQVARFFGGVNFWRGIKRGKVVETAVGPLEVEQLNIPDGEVLVTIRPEAIEIGANGHNNFSARIRAYNYRGLIAYCHTGVEGLELQVLAPPFRPYHEGEQITLHLPRERICLFNADAPPLDIHSMPT